MTETAVARVEPAVVLTREDIKKYICPTADDKEIFMFLGICKSFGLNPMKREVHLIKYGNSPASIVTGYEVYLKRAERTQKLNGWGVEVSKDGESATVTIHRKDWQQPFTWTAYRKEFDKQQANWRSMPMFMLRKVAMAQAFRICFPDEMGGLPYLPEEISGSSSESLPTHETKMLDPPAPAVSAPEVAVEVVEPVVANPVAPPPVVTVEKPSPAPPSTEKKDDATLRHELQELAAIAVDAGHFQTEAQAIYFATAYTTKDGKEAGYKDVVKLKGWQMSKAIAKLSAKLDEKPSTLDEERNDDIKF